MNLDYTFRDKEKNKFYQTFCTPSKSKTAFMNCTRIVALSVLMTSLFAASCHKADVESFANADFAPNEGPVIFKSKSFPKGILQFDSKDRFVAFYNSLLDGNRETMNKIPVSFQSFAKKIASNSQTLTRTSTVDTAAYLLDVEQSLTPEIQSDLVLDENLEVIIENHLYKLSTIGTFVVDMSQIDQFRTLYDQYEMQMLFDTSFSSVPGEVEIAVNQFRVKEGVVRHETNVDIYHQRHAPVSNDNDPNNPGSSGGTYIPPCSVTLPVGFQHDLKLVSTEFDVKHYKEVETDRRFKFEAFNTNFLSLGLLRTVGVRGVCQRRKSFLGIRYWAESYADEIVVGAVNASVVTSYQLPSPTTYNTLTSPQWVGILNLKIGNKIAQAVQVNANIYAPFGLTVSASSINNFLNNTLNSYQNGLITDHFTPFMNNIISDIDASYVSRYATYAKMLETLYETNRLRYSFANFYAPQGYSHINVWRFDWNIGQNSNGKAYSYEVKAGNLVGRMRLGCKWYGIRLLVQ